MNPAENVGFSIKRSKHPFTAALLAASLLAGCANPGFDERRDAAQELEASLEEETGRIIEASNGCITLSNAVAIVRERSLNVLWTFV